MEKKLAHCPNCGENIVAKENKIKELKEKTKRMKKGNDKLEQLNKKIEDLVNNKEMTPYEKRIALFNLVKNLNLGDTSPEKKKRTNYLLQAHLYSDLAKQSMQDYKKITAETFNKEK